MAMSGNAFASGGGGAAGGVGALTQYAQGADQGIWGLLRNLFNNNKSPYGEGFDATKPYFDKSQSFQNPFVQQGQEASGNFNEWLSKMKDPQEFINHIMGGYQESPWAKNLQQSSVRAGQNAASANGTLGSTPFAQQLQQNATNISSQDQNNWLQNVVGANNQYGAGLNTQIDRGQHASDILSQLFQTQGNMAGGAAYGDQAWDNQNSDSMWANIAKIFGG